jgi:hypothetical protein
MLNKYLQNSDGFISQINHERKITDKERMPSQCNRMLRLKIGGPQVKSHFLLAYEIKTRFGFFNSLRLKQL